MIGDKKFSLVQERKILLSRETLDNNGNLVWVKLSHHIRILDSLTYNKLNMEKTKHTQSKQRHRQSKYLQTHHKIYVL